MDKNVFISYSWDDVLHKRKVKSFIKKLRDNNVNAIYDGDERSASEGWITWMENKIEESSIVLIIFTQKYLDRWKKKNMASSGEGVRVETTVIKNLFKKDGSYNNKFIPIVLKNSDLEFIPPLLRDFTPYNIAKKDDFLKLVNYINKNNSKLKVDNNSTVNLYKNPIKGHYNILINMKRGIQDLQNELICAIDTEEYIDQKFLYITHESRENWKELVHSDNYTLHPTSNKTLKKFLDTEYWKQLCSALDTIVDLGVGTAENDPKIINSFLENTDEENVLFIALDSSVPMLEHALAYIPRRVDSTRYKLESLKTDFMKLNDSKKLFQRDKEKITVFFMIGGTICNIREDLFLDSLGSVCNKGDIFVVGVALLIPEKDIIKDYENDALNTLLQEPLKKSGYETKNKCNKKWLSDIEQRKWSVIKNSKTLLMQVEARASNTETFRLITVGSATRYSLPDFVEYFKDRGFLKKKESFSKDKSFAYISFEYKGEEI